MEEDKDGLCLHRVLFVLGSKRRWLPRPQAYTACAGLTGEHERKGQPSGCALQQRVLEP